MKFSFKFFDKSMKDIIKEALTCALYVGTFVFVLALTVILGGKN